jgi:hypothetical protein
MNGHDYQTQGMEFALCAKTNEAAQMLPQRNKVSLPYLNYSQYIQ